MLERLKCPGVSRQDSGVRGGGGKEKRVENHVCDDTGAWDPQWAQAAGSGKPEESGFPPGWQSCKAQGDGDYTPWDQVWVLFLHVCGPGIHTHVRKR